MSVFRPNLPVFGWVQAPPARPGRLTRPVESRPHQIRLLAWATRIYLGSSGRGARRGAHRGVPRASQHAQLSRRRQDHAWHG